MGWTLLGRHRRDLLKSLANSGSAKVCRSLVCAMQSLLLSVQSDNLDKAPERVRGTDRFSIWLENDAVGIKENSLEYKVI